jgi:hypothetical protein
VKIVVVADVHVHPWRICSRDGGHDRLLDALSALRQSLDLARAERAAWVMAGDFKQPKNVWPQEALTGAHAILREYPDVDKVMVAGNHDAEGLGGSGLAPFKDVARVVEKTDVVIIPAGQFVCVPWNGNMDLARRAVDAHPGSALVAHAFLAGCMLGPEDTRIAKGASVSDYGSFSVAFFGDVHKGQWRRPGQHTLPSWTAYPHDSFEVPMEIRRPGPWTGEVFYAGSSYQQNWGEREDPPKGALLVDMASGGVWLCPLKSPRFRHVEVDEAGLEKLEDDGSLDEMAGDFVRVVYTGKPSPALDALKGWTFRSLQVIVRRSEQATRRADVHAGMPMRKLLEEYVEARPPGDGVDRARALEAGVRLTDA